MSDHDTTTANTAESGSFVGIQAEQVHNSTVYMVSSDDPPEWKYRVGVRYLDNGVPLRARELITEAIAHGYANAEVRFHWVLAMLSKRSYRELDAEDRAQLAQLPGWLVTCVGDEWTRALEALCELLKYLGSPDGDPAAALAKLEALPARQREKIGRHCDLVLTGSMKDRFWADRRRAAERGRCAGDREKRVWAYFQPDPAHPRIRQPAPKATTLDDRLRAVLATGLLVASFGALGWILLQRQTPVPVIACLVLLVSGVVAARSGFEWRYRTQRLRAKERERVGRFDDHEAGEPGFAKRVDHAFQYYAHKYAPEGVARAVWLAETRGIRATLRDEIVELYRESRITVGEITWLIRYVIRDVRRQWRKGLLFAYREQYRTSVSTKVTCLSALAVAALALGAVADAAVRTDPLPALGSVLITVAGGRVATIRWWRILSERRRYSEEARERACDLEAREAEYRRWKGKLEATCPTEDEMAAWLECDRAMLMDEALRHYRLAWRDVIADTIVQTPARNRKRARVNGGPWRYPKYDLRLFLITADGVRELTRRLDFENASFHGCERGHFRFDAVSSLQVVESGEYDYTLELTLSNGPSRIIDVTEPPREIEQQATDEPGLSQISLDSTGFAHALHVLEGIAAEGKAWIHRATSTRNVGPAFPGAESTA
ncbi:hypothetical protein [Saccharopolyspora phatthalungensis]|uniref:Uncharacterized protein n=1 Tax=Saccharopolyspora phatthalungensis TaxID=664693 RepID=A0A840QJK4_9PSEU|nr:hypothetical protein [Saccharopolyspora phatthalungensis]MBB5159249.1 hypothetical protein [Saccharopolyspora phatthalungensis]